MYFELNTNFITACFGTPGVSSSGHPYVDTCNTSELECTNSEALVVSNLTCTVLTKLIFHRAESFPRSWQVTS